MEQPQVVTIAAAQYEIQQVGQWERYAAKVEALVEEAVAEGGQILVLPEYACMELLSILPERHCASLEEQLEGVQAYFQDYLGLFQRLAQQHGVYILAGTFPERLPEGCYRNRAYFFAPNGTFDFQEKLIMTPFEREDWSIQAGKVIKIFSTDYGRIGVSICYDGEFPLLTRKQVEAGAEIVLVPSCTGTLAGYHRVRVSCQARAVENQCYTVQSPTFGTTDGSAALGETVGAAAVFAPMDHGFPPDGVVAMGEMNRPQWVYAEVSPAALEAVRREGEVYNFQDLDRQLDFQSRLVAMATL